jgi:hypothetical protein
MNSLALLLMATAAAGADPQPVVQETIIPAGSYTSTDAAPDSRPGFLGRIRNALGSKSSATPTYPASGPGTTVIGTSPTVSPPLRYVPSGSSAEPPLANTVPVTTPAPAADVRPATPPAVVSQPVYTYPAPTPAPAPESNRPRLFPRVRKLFGGSSSQPSSQALPEGMIVTPQVVTPTPAPAAPVIQGQPQRMPIGNP